MQDIFDKRSLFARHWLLCRLNDGEADRLSRFTRVEHYPVGKVLFREGDPGGNMVAVLKGRIKVSKCSADGREVILTIIGPGEILGEMALLSAAERSADATTLEQCDLLVIERRDFLPILEQNPHLCIELLDAVFQRLRKTSVRLEETVFLDRSARLAKALLRLADEHGRETPDGLQIELKLSQRELGHLVGLTRETMNRQLSAWREEGIVNLGIDGLITIADFEALEALSEGV